VEDESLNGEEKWMNTKKKKERIRNCIEGKIQKLKETIISSVHSMAVVPL